MTAEIGNTAISKNIIAKTINLMIELKRSNTDIKIKNEHKRKTSEGLIENSMMMIDFVTIKKNKDIHKSIEEIGHKIETTITKDKTK